MCPPLNRSFSAASNASSQICIVQHQLKTCTSTSQHDNGFCSFVIEQTWRVRNSAKKTCHLLQFLYRHKHTCFLNIFPIPHFAIVTKTFSSHLSGTKLWMFKIKKSNAWNLKFSSVQLSDLTVILQLFVLVKNTELLITTLLASNT